MDVSRRDLLKGGAVFGAGLAVSAGLMGASVLPGCAPSKAAPSEAGPTSGGTDAPTGGSGNPNAGYETGIDWLGTPPEIADADVTATFDGDIVVCGGGNAGIQAALAAAEGGAKVHVLETAPEKFRKVKGRDVGHVNSQWLIDQGFGPYDEGEIVDEFMHRCAGRNNAEMIKRFVYNSGETFDHMISLVNWPDDRIKPVTRSNPDVSPTDPSSMYVPQAAGVLDGPVEYPVTQGGFKSWASTASVVGEISHVIGDESGIDSNDYSRFDEIQQFSILKSQELGAEWHYEQRARVLITDDSGAVVGVYAENEDGTYTRYNAKTGVILCTGDFGGNVEMSWALLAEIAECAARAGKGPEDIRAESMCEGDGHKMACWIGGEIEPLPRPILNYYWTGAPWGTVPYLWLNSEGKRFMNEAATTLAWPNGLRQPLGPICTISDSKWFDVMKKGGIDLGAPNAGRQDYILELKEDVDNVPLGDPNGGRCRDSVECERQPHIVYKADTIEELCGFMGFSDEAIKEAVASVERYNELCWQGRDTDFDKDEKFLSPIDEPPYIGSFFENERWSGIGLVCFAGLLTDSHLQVLDGEGKRIPGLWAAGNCLGGRYGVGYVTPIAGNSIGMAITHGRVAGKVAIGQEVR